MSAPKSTATDPTEPLLFVAMPYGERHDPTGRHRVNFDALFNDCILLAARDAKVQAIRADQETLGGFAIKPMFERLLLSEIVIADLTFSNPNVAYELGIRHAARPRSTILLTAEPTALPFDLAAIRAVTYKVGSSGLLDDEEAERLRSVIGEYLAVAKAHGDADSPLFKLLPEWKVTPLSHKATEAFRERAIYSSELGGRLREAGKLEPRERALEALQALEEELNALAEPEEELLVALLLEFRGNSAWRDMLRVVDGMRPQLRRATKVREQTALALNRDKQTRRALEVIEELIAKHGGTAERYGIQGRCFKDLWDDAVKEGDPDADDDLDAAIAAYGRGFEAEPLDFYPGINYATLLERRGRADDRERLREVLPVVKQATLWARRTGDRDYWSLATVLEVAALEDNEEWARKTCRELLRLEHTSMETETTAKNLRIIASGRGAEGEWIARLADRLERGAG